MRSTLYLLRDFGRLLADLRRAIWKRRAWWMIPVIVVLLLVIALVVLAETPLGPFIYTLF